MKNKTACKQSYSEKIICHFCNAHMSGGNSTTHINWMHGLTYNCENREQYKKISKN